MGKALFGFPDWTIHSPDLVWSGGGWETGLPLENLADPDVSLVARSTDATTANTTLRADLGSANNKTIKVLGLFNHNLSPQATVRIRIGSVADMSSGVQYDSTALVAYDDIFPASHPEWETAALQTGDIEDDAYFDRSYKANYIVVPNGETGYNYRYLRIDIADTGNNDGFIQIGRLPICSGWSPDVNFTEGAAIGFEESSEAIEKESGRFLHIDRPRRRVFSATFPEASDDDYLVHFWRMLEFLGTSGQFTFVYDQEDTIHMHRRAFLATFEAQDRARINWGTRYDVPVKIREAI